MMRKVNNIIRLGFAMALVLSAVCCGRKNPNAERSDFIRVYENRDSDLPLDRTWVSVKGGTYTYYIISAPPSIFPRHGRARTFRGRSWESSGNWKMACGA